MLRIQYNLWSLNKQSNYISDSKSVQEGNGRMVETEESISYIVPKMPLEDGFFYFKKSRRQQFCY